MVLYGAEFWSSALKFNWAKLILSQIQRACMLRVCKAYRTVSYEASCILANILPLEYKADELTRLRGVKSSGVFNIEGETITVQRGVLSGRHPAGCVRGFVDLSTHRVDTDGFCIFTDGSKSDDGVGSAFVVYDHSVELCHRIFSLPDYCSVFQAELLALKKALEFLLEKWPSISVRIYSDSLSSLMAIQDRNSDTPMVIQIQDILVQLRRLGMAVKLSWVKAHIGIDGNERADQLAKSCLTPEAEMVELEAPLSFAKRHIRIVERINWNKDWRCTKNGSWTRRIFPTVERRRRAGQFQLDFVLTQFLSGHGKFGEYLTRFNRRDDPSCECDGFQDPEHLLFDCPLLDDLRMDIVAECNTRGERFQVASIGTLLANDSTRELFMSFLQATHQRLVLWEVC